MAFSNLLHRARQGDSAAIATLLNHTLQPQSIRAYVFLRRHHLQILLESVHPLQWETVTTWLTDWVQQIPLPNIQYLDIFWRAPGDPIPAWSQRLDLRQPQVPRSGDPPQPAHRWCRQRRSRLQLALPKPHLKSAGLLALSLILLGTVMHWIGQRRVHFSQGQDTLAAIGIPGPSSAPIQIGLIQQAFRHATNAASLNQSAYSFNDWQIVAEYWQDAIELLEIVPAESQDYPLAQTKMAEYQKNLVYAQQQAAKFSSHADGLVEKAVYQSVPAANLPTTERTCQPSTSPGQAQPLEFTRLKFYRPNGSAEAYLIGCIRNRSNHTINTVGVTYKGTSKQRPDHFEGGFDLLQLQPLKPGETVPFQSRFTFGPNTTTAEISAIYWRSGNEDLQEQPANVLLNR